jgi:hypothetical protein
MLAVPSVNSDHLTYKVIPEDAKEDEDVVYVATEAGKPADAAAAAAPRQPRSAFDAMRQPDRFVPTRKTGTKLDDVSSIEYALYQS